MIADIAAENPDGGANRQRGEFGELFHVGIASFAAAQGIVIRRIWRNIRVAPGHPTTPVSLNRRRQAGMAAARDCMSEFTSMRLSRGDAVIPG
jgi:hypothetical protein